MNAMRPKAARAVVAVFATVLVLAACSGGSGGSGGSGTPVSGGDLTLATNNDVPSWDPARCNQASFERCYPLFSTLVRYNPETEEFDPLMAESFETEDGQVWTLTLREGITFTDGTPYDAEAVVYNWDRFADPANLSQAVGFLARASWEVIDPLTVELTMDEPDYSIPWVLQFDIGLLGSPTAFEELGDDFGANPIGAGPFILDSWTPTSVIEFVRNPDYWEEGLPYLDSITMRVIQDDAQRQDAFRSGAVQAYQSFQPIAADQLEDEGYTVYRLPQIGGSGYAFNLSDPDMADEDLRMALLKSTDAAQINSAVPHLDATTAFLGPDNPFRDDSLGVYPELDLGEAQDHLDAFLARTGRSSFVITLEGYTAFPQMTLAAELLQSQWGQLDGLSVEINAHDPQALQGVQRAREFQVIQGNFGGGTTTYRLFDLFHSTGALNNWGYANDEVDAALETTRRSNDPDEVAEAFAIMNGLVSSDPPLRTWRQELGNYITIDAVQGVEPLTSFGYPFYERVWLDE